MLFPWLKFFPGSLLPTAVILRHDHTSQPPAVPQDAECLAHPQGFWLNWLLDRVQVSGFFLKAHMILFFKA